MNEPPDREADAPKPPKKLEDLTSLELVRMLEELDPEIYAEVLKDLESSGLILRRRGSSERDGLRASFGPVRASPERSLAVLSGKERPAAEAPKPT